MEEDKRDYILILGRCGINYFDEHGQGYFIDSEMMAGGEYSYALYLSGIFLMDKKTHPPQEVQNHIIERVQYLSNLKNMRAHWFPDNK